MSRVHKDSIDEFDEFRDSQFAFVHRPYTSRSQCGSRKGNSERIESGAQLQAQARACELSAPDSPGINSVCHPVFSQ
jgi:hypothetical protein